MASGRMRVPRTTGHPDTLPGTTSASRRPSNQGLRLYSRWPCLLPLLIVTLRIGSVGRSIVSSQTVVSAIRFHASFRLRWNELWRKRPRVMIVRRRGRDSVGGAGFSSSERRCEMELRLEPVIPPSLDSSQGMWRLPRWVGQILAWLTRKCCKPPARKEPFVMLKTGVN